MFALSFDRVAVEALIAGRSDPSATMKLSPQDDIAIFRDRKNGIED